MDSLPEELLRLIVDRLDTRSILAMECAVPAVAKLGRGGLDVFITPSRRRRGADAWLDKHGHRVRSLKCIGCTVRIPPGLETFAVICATMPRNIFHSLGNPGAACGVRDLTFTCPNGIPDAVRDYTLMQLPVLEKLSLRFLRGKRCARVDPPRRLTALAISTPNKLTVLRMPVGLKHLLLAAKREIISFESVPENIDSVRIFCETPMVTFSSLFSEACYPDLRRFKVCVGGTPSLMPVVEKMTGLSSLFVAADTIIVGDELAVPDRLKRLEMHARYCFAIGFVMETSVARLGRVPRVKATTFGEKFDFLDYYGTLVR